MAKVLFIVSGATYWVLKDGTRYAAGYWAEEFANPYKIVTEAGHDVVVATPDGVTPNVDMMSLRPEMAGGVQGALELEAIIRSAEEMRRPLKLSDVRLEDYDAVYLPGGHGPMADLAFDADAGRLLTAQLTTALKNVRDFTACRPDDSEIPCVRVRFGEEQLMDVQMPEMSGLEATEAIRARESGTPVTRASWR